MQKWSYTKNKTKQALGKEETDLGGSLSVASAIFVWSSPISIAHHSCSILSLNCSALHHILIRHSAPVVPEIMWRGARWSALRISGVEAAWRKQFLWWVAHFPCTGYQSETLSVFLVTWIYFPYMFRISSKSSSIPWACLPEGKLRSGRLMGPTTVLLQISRTTDMYLSSSSIYFRSS